MEGPPADALCFPELSQWACFVYTEGNEAIIFSKDFECAKPCGPPQIVLNEIIWEGWYAWEDQKARGPLEKTLMITLCEDGNRIISEGPFMGRLRSRKWPSGTFATIQPTKRLRRSSKGPE